MRKILKRQTPAGVCTDGVVCPTAMDSDAMQDRNRSWPGNSGFDQDLAERLDIADFHSGWLARYFVMSVEHTGRPFSVHKRSTTRIRSRFRPRYRTTLFRLDMECSHLFHEFPDALSVQWARIQGRHF